MAQSRKVLSDPDLQAYSRDHLLYEITMMVNCAQILRTSLQSSSPELARALTNAIIESFAIHVRNLVDFLYPGVNIHGDDVIADDFFPRGKRPATFPTLSSILEVARKRAHKQVSHLTTGRLSGISPRKEWRHTELVTEVLKILVQLAKDASPNKLDQTVFEFISAHAPKVP